MSDRNVSGMVIASVTMLLCSAYNAVFNILRRFSHLLGNVRTAAELKIDYTNPPVWKDIAFSVYDLIVIFNLSAGILALLQLIAAISGFVCAARHGLRKEPLKSALPPYVLGIICSLVGTVSVFSMIAARSAGTVLSAVLVLTQLVVPILFAAEAGKFHSRLRNTLSSNNEED